MNKFKVGDVVQGMCLTQGSPVETFVLGMISHIMTDTTKEGTNTTYKLIFNNTTFFVIDKFDKLSIVRQYV